MKAIHAYTQEEWFIAWCNELIAAGYIKKILAGDEIEPLQVYGGYSMTHTITGESKTITKKILAPVRYKPDVIIFWEPKAKSIFYNLIGEWKSCYFYAAISDLNTDLIITPVDVKAPPGSTKMNTSDSSFRILQKWIFHELGIFINKSVNWPGGVIKNKDKSFKRFKNPEPYLWMMTFTPERYLYTNVKMEPKIISKWDPISLEQFLASKKPSAK